MKFLLITSMLVSCGNQGSQTETVPGSVIKLKRLMESQPKVSELRSMIEAMDLPLEMSWHQGSPYTFTTWKLESDWRVSVYGWGDITTHAELFDPESQTVVKLFYKTSEEARN